ncbi:type II CAAX endopeptidase family protein [Thalassovita sp.]|uniref:CPBP family intramembrane glutamic endopeptidase n=1 Tax=Thalassovita sp. TaxID=1979401 RepID=UPI002B266749|nr:type II CAAX endopeptidase family protein [Thalassovita sp.]
MQSDYSAHETFIQPARPRAELWRLAVGLFMAMVIYIGLIWAMQALALAVLSDEGYFLFNLHTRNGRTPVGALYLLTSFGFLTVALAAVAQQLHRRNPLSLLGPPALALRQGWAVFKAVALLYLALSVLPPYDLLPDGAVQRAVGQWAMLLPVALPALLIQTSAEELLFRGYLQQQLAARFTSRWVWMLVPAVLFGLMHYRADAGANTWILVSWAAAFSIAASDLTARAGTLGPAIALHFISNAIAILLVSQDDALSGLALFSAPVDMADPDALRPLLLLDLGVLFISWLAARLALRR